MSTTNMVNDKYMKKERNTENEWLDTKDERFMSWLLP